MTLRDDRGCILGRTTNCKLDHFLRLTWTELALGRLARQDIADLGW